MRNSPNRIVATVFGAVYILVGILGFTVTAGVGFVATDGELLLGIFEVNPLHNVAHLLIGDVVQRVHLEDSEENPLHNVAHLLIGAALLIGGLSNVRAAKGVNIVVGAAYLLLGIVGFFIADTAANVLALNTNDHFLHLASALVLLGVGIAADKNVSPREAV